MEQSGYSFPDYMTRNDKTASGDANFFSNDKELRLDSQQYVFLSAFRDREKRRLENVSGTPSDCPSCS
jgi:hypothetical protein